MSGTTKGLNRQQMADRIAFEFQDGWIVNLGVGIPTMCSNTDIGDRDITYHSENGVIGYGPIAPEGEEDLNLVNAGGQNVTLKPGAAVVHHADSFAIIRGGRIDVTVMGAYEVACNGDFANWKMRGRRAAASAARWTSRRAPSACSSSWSRPRATEPAAGVAMRAAGDGARRGEAGGDELTDCSNRPATGSDARDRARRHAGRGARDDRLQADGAGRSADGAGGKLWSGSDR